MDESQASRIIEMGCYGIGVSRILAASIETSCDAAGIKWPDSIAPYRLVIIPIGDSSDTGKLMEQAETLAAKMVAEVRNNHYGGSFKTDQLGFH